MYIMIEIDITSQFDISVPEQVFEVSTSLN